MNPSLADGSEDVTDFLQRIKELGDKRDFEDDERNRKLEEEILQGRKERQARRAERARSISPTKSSPSNTPIASRTSTAQSTTLSQTFSATNDSVKGVEPRRDSALDDAMDRLTGSPTKENILPQNGGREMVEPDLERVSPIKASPSSAMPSRNSPLSWQRRPTSQASDRPRSRPLSMVATENAARSPRATPEPTFESAPDTIPSRDQIAQSLASKDPAWFRQTADRGTNSPAYRRNQVEDEDRSDHGTSSSRVQMPGMSRVDQKSIDDPVDRASSPSRSSLGRETTSRAPGIGSPVPLTSAQKFEPPNMDSVTGSRGLAMSPSQGRISPDRLDRPVSPTKGMGGFVQSAMMKRSDSVNKRWSVQSPPGLSRGNSIASNRSTQDPSTPLALGSIVNTTVGVSRPSSLSRENSPRPLSRPTSSHSNATITQDERPDTASSVRSSLTASTNNDGFVKPSLPASRSQTPEDNKSGSEKPPGERDMLPTSPSKTMDPKRWSPTKSSWLESALNKPESPKPKPALPPQQPSWMSEINKAKQKGSVDLGRSPTNTPKHEVNIGGLLRSPPPGGLIKPISIGGLPAGFSSGAAPKGRSESVSSQSSKMSPSKEDPSETGSPIPTTKAKVPVAIKEKPETPPKKDFRANLKPRQTPAESGKEEPEFKNVFGQLRRTKTQNYVAPDELKDNITRGKAALNFTGGPKKTERKDEFKDAILKKKEDFKKAQQQGKGVARSTSGSNQDAPLPEALAKRKVLGKSEATSVDTLSASEKIIQEIPTRVPLAETSVPSRVQGQDAIGSKLAGRFNPALAGLLARGPPSAASATSRSSSPAMSQRTASMSTSTTNGESTEPGPQLTHMTKARARGPRRKAPSTNPVAAPVNEEKLTGTSTSGLVSLSSVSTNKVSERMPKPVKTAQDVTSPVELENPTSQPSSPRKLDLKRRSQFLQEVPNSSNKGESQLDPPKPLSPIKKANSTEIPVKQEESKAEAISSPVAKTKPSTPVKSPSLINRTFERPPVAEQTDSPETAKLRPAPLSPQKVAIRDVPREDPSIIRPKASPSETRVNQPAIAKVEAPTASVSVRNATAKWDRPTATQSAANPPRARSPIKLPTHVDEKAAMVEAGLRPASPVKDDGSAGQTTRVSASARPLPTPPFKGPLSPPPSAGLMPSSTSTKPDMSPVPQTSEASRLVGDFFGPHDTPPEFVADTASILSARRNQDTSIKTLRSSLYQFSGDGHKQLVPSHQERLLFEGNMYICVHSFGNASGKKITEIYFWVGDEVPERSMEGAKIHVQKEAKAAGGSLITLRQGKETPEFFQALGGIIIIRRGSSNKYDSLAPHMLCGRRHFGQIAFDEVDYTPASLCSGFPYLILTQSGKSYLWKGRGSGIDELSCARLIGMDFGLTGEIEEVEDGKEPDSFLQIFGNDSRIPKSADHWRMKPNYNKYCGRLFRANSSAQSQIVEISPFCQADVSPSNIYILDAFFEIYIIVGSRAQSQYSAFHNALMFAQEYSILAAGMEDRPYVPITTVVLEGVPRDMKSVFRKWRDGLTPTIMRPASPGLQRGRSLRIVPLTAALEATRRA